MKNYNVTLGEYLHSDFFDPLPRLASNQVEQSGQPNCPEGYRREFLRKHSKCSDHYEFSTKSGTVALKNVSRRGGQETTDFCIYLEKLKDNDNLTISALTCVPIPKQDKYKYILINI